MGLINLCGSMEAWKQSVPKKKCLRGFGLAGRQSSLKNGTLPHASIRGGASLHDTTLDSVLKPLKGPLRAQRLVYT